MFGRTSSILYNITRYTVQNFISSSIESYFKKCYKVHRTYYRKEVADETYGILISQLYSSALTEALLYPLDTCMARLQLGMCIVAAETKDEGFQILPTNYAGIKDCIYEILRREGFRGFYKGFGILVQQYSFKIVIVTTIYKLFLKI